MPARKKHRIIIDTNLWISFLLTKDFSKLDTLFQNEKITILFSEELIEEFIEVAKRPKFRKYFSISDLQELMLSLRNKAEFIEVTSVINICRDHKDNFLLSLAVDGFATHLLTGDNDLLVLSKSGKTKIQTLKEFLESEND